MENRLFSLLRIGLEISTPQNEDLSLFTDIDNQQWGKLISIAQEQGVLGFVFDGIEKIGPYIKIEKNPMWLFEAYNGVLWRESLNTKQRNTIEELCALWRKNGIQMLLLKGQANALYYPKPLHRDCGDIDCYLFDKYSKGNDIIKAEGIKVNEDWEKHSKFSYKGETIENHQFFVQTLDEKWWKPLHAELASLISADIPEFPESNVLVAPTQFNALFLTYHAMEHFTMGNLKLKQICDWAMFVKINQENIDWSLLRMQCEKYGMDTFLHVMNGFIFKYFGIRAKVIDNQLLNDPILKRVAKSVFNDNDFVWGDENKNKWTRRIHYIQYNVNNIWKLRIAGRSLLKQVWLYAITYGERKV